MTIHNSSAAFMHGYTVEMTVDRCQHVQGLLIKTVIEMIVNAEWELQDEIEVAKDLFGEEDQEDEAAEDPDSDGWTWEERCADVFEALLDKMP